MLALLLAVSGCIGASQVAGQVTAQASETGNRIGDIAPDFTVTTTDGKTIKLSELRGKPVMLYFFATWCPFCFRDLTAAKDVYPEYKDKVAFVAVDLDVNENAQLIGSYKKRNGFLGDFAPGTRKILLDYSITSTTSKYLISKDGIIVFKSSGEVSKETWRKLFSALVEN